VIFHIKLVGSAHLDNPQQKSVSHIGMLFKVLE